MPAIEITDAKFSPKVAEGDYVIESAFWEVWFTKEGVVGSERIYLDNTASEAEFIAAIDRATGA